HSTNLLAQDPLHVVAAVLGEHLHNLEAYTLLAAHTGHDHVYLGALKGRAGSLASLARVHQAFMSLGCAVVCWRYLRGL
ncbi:MAG: hypothetical protein M3Q08_17190, partial [Pseudomonadota bacterium]|nr:hypothetical protein [Pseudomonadota bacterium]